MSRSEAGGRRGSGKKQERRELAVRSLLSNVAAKTEARRGAGRPQRETGETLITPTSFGWKPDRRGLDAGNIGGENERFFNLRRKPLSVREMTVH